MDMIELIQTRVWWAQKHETQQGAWACLYSATFTALAARWQPCHCPRSWLNTRELYSGFISNRASAAGARSCGFNFYLFFVKTAEREFTWLSDTS